ncbi:dimethylaniline monooxygenase [Pleomassaria siparia CBS 279.74]|uniref:Dimethylaniline monooxygenase n=1 Tax=Pleomassaria siparia CBS 279.74 TaxID=1314801 RepID=A0A6G1K6K0_9PLEO|nr:dimethylaniline monooxygenase [Pleomassaria siparia CBS 279.74]
MSDKQVIIIGAGPSGICAGVQLQRLLGHKNVHFYERSSDMGGVWFNNTYPGCAVDIPAHFYSYSFALKPDWPKLFPVQRDLNDYFHNVAEEYDLLRRMTFNVECYGMDWDQRRSLWTVRFRRTNDHSITFEREAPIVICAIGKLDLPNIPDIKGRDTFEGVQFHSARWDHSVNLKGKNVVVLGNGASGTQFVPKISEYVGRLTQIVRSAHYIQERLNPHYSALFQWIMKYIPGACRVHRWSWYWAMEKQFGAFWMTERGERKRVDVAQETWDYIDKAAPEKYKDILRPDYLVGCRRRVHSNKYLECLHRENVDLIHDDVIEITKDSVITKAGRTIPADAIIYATGFRTQDWLWPMEIRGIDGQEMHELWEKRGQVQAYYGTAHDQFPNWFTLYGPNTGSGHNSVIYQTECQVNFLCRMLRPVLQGNAKSVVPKYEAQKKLNDRIQESLPKLTFSAGCTSWFIDKFGRNTYVWPNYTFMFWFETVKIKWSEVLVDYPKRSGYFGKETGVLPNVFTLGSIVLLSLLVTGTVSSHSFDRVAESAGEMVRQLSSRIQA